jgi:hypothetical protein
MSVMKKHWHASEVVDPAPERPERCQACGEIVDDDDETNVHGFCSYCASVWRRLLAD